MKYKVGMVSLGCVKNQVDAELLLSKINEGGYEVIADAALADVAIVNTCGFIEDAKKESIEEILELANLKKEGQIKKIVVTGCLAERYREEISKEMPEVDAVIGIGSNKDIVSLLDEVMKGERKESFGEKCALPLEGRRMLSTPGYYAYLKVSDGCDNRCTYCAIPLIRGGFRSRTMQSIIDEAKDLANRGVKELIVVAQDTTRYGLDLYGEISLSKLLKELCKIDGFKWIRLLYCYPDNITDELIDTIANEEKIVKYIDLPLQHCDERVLKNMNRRGSRAELTALIKKMRERIPNVVIRTTFITGFPGESEEEFTELAEFVKDIEFERMGCFAYSQEEGTPAAEFDLQVEDSVKSRRQELLMDTQSRVTEKYCSSMIGKELTVVVEGYDRLAQCCFGRSYADSPDVDGKIFFTAKNKKLTQGDFITVKITDYMDYDLIGEMLQS